MLQFLSNEQNLANALTAQYDFFLVTLSYLIACVAAYSSWTIASVINKLNKPQRLIWQIGGATAMGSGVWAMHFLGMLAFKLPVQVTYDPWITAISLVPAILASGIVIQQFSHPRLQVKQLLANGILMGSGIGLMHYIGMAAMRLPAEMYYDFPVFLLSIVVAILLSIVAISVKYWARQHVRTLWKNAWQLLGVMLMGAAVAGMHYTAMAAVYYFPINNVSTITGAISITNLSLLVVIISSALLLVAISISLLEIKNLETMDTLNQTRVRIAQAIESLSEGFILFNSSDQMVMSNKVYRNMYPELESALQPGIDYSKLIKLRDQRVFNSPEEKAKYVKRRLAWHRNPVDAFDDTLSDGRNVLGRERRAPNGDLIGVWTDISNLMQMHEQLLQKERQQRAILDASPVATMIRETEHNKLLYFNSASSELMAKNKLSPPDDGLWLLSDEDYNHIKTHKLQRGNINNYEVAAKLSDGNLLNLLVSGVRIIFEEKTCLLMTLIDITERKKMEEELRRLSSTDPLTGVMNRRQFMSLAAQHLERCKRNSLSMSLIMMDLDQFKLINDTHGHLGGDMVLKHFCKLCSESIRDIDLFARIGGEEFVLLVLDKGGDVVKNEVAERIRQYTECNPAPFNDGELISFSVSMGVVELIDGENINLQEMLDGADRCLYHAKNTGRNKVVSVQDINDSGPFPD